MISQHEKSDLLHLLQEVALDPFELLQPIFVNDFADMGRATNACKFYPIGLWNEISRFHLSPEYTEMVIVEFLLLLTFHLVPVGQSHTLNLSKKIPFHAFYFVRNSAQGIYQLLPYMYSIRLAALAASHVVPFLLPSIQLGLPSALQLADSTPRLL
jgi:hypothetical protein